MTDDQFLDLMDIWVRWMRSPDKPLYYPRRAAVCGASVSNMMAGEDDPDIVYENLDRDIAKRVDACIKDLEPHEVAAIYRAHGLATVFRFPRLDYAETLRAAMLRLRANVSRRC